MGEEGTTVARQGPLFPVTPIAAAAPLHRLGPPLRTQARIRLVAGPDADGRECREAVRRLSLAADIPVLKTVVRARVPPPKLWGVSEAKETVHHILRGGEDSIGVLEAIQRVYFNIGSCSEQCWVNHFSDLRQIDPQQRGFGQTPFEIGQCRRDCPNFRAIEDRLPNILAFFLSKEAHLSLIHISEPTRPY